MPRMALLGAGAPVAAYTYLLDQFAGSDGTLITARPADTGESWTAQSQAFDVSSNQARVNATSNDQVCIATIVSPFGADATIEVAQTKNNDSARPVGIVGRWTDANNYWLIRNDIAGNGFRIIQVTAGVETLRAFGNPSISNGVEFIMRVVFNANTITATIGATTISWASASQGNTATIFGIYAKYSTVVGQRDLFNYFLLWQGSGSPPANPIYPFP